MTPSRRTIFSKKVGRANGALQEQRHPAPGAPPVGSSPGQRDARPSTVFAMLRNRWLLLALGVILGSVGGLVFAAAEDRTYTASAYAVVVPEDTDPAALQAATSVAQGYARVATKPNLVASGLATQGLAIAPDQVRQDVRVSASPETPILEIFATRPRRDEAGRLADAVVDGLVANSTALRPGIGYRVQRFVATSTPTTPSNPSTLFYAGLGGTAGLMIAGVIAFGLGQTTRSRQLAGAPRFARPSPGQESASTAKPAGRSRV